MGMLTLLVPGALLCDAAEPEVSAVSMRWADASRNGRPFSKDPCVIRFNDRYLLYFSLPPSTNKIDPPGWAIGIAESKNLRDWRRVGELLPAQECDRMGLCAPGALVRNGKVHLFYQTYGNGPKDAICHAISSDGVRFERDASNPVFRPTGSWNNGRAIDAEVFPVGERLMLYFATRDPAGKVQKLGVATADLQSDYSRSAWRQACDESILQPELPWERDCIEAPSVCQRDGTLFLFYAGAYNNAPQQIGVATSQDGLKWTRLSLRAACHERPTGRMEFLRVGSSRRVRGRRRADASVLPGQQRQGQDLVAGECKVGVDGWTAACGEALISPPLTPRR